MPASLGGSVRGCCTSGLDLEVETEQTRPGGNHQGQRSMSGQFGKPCLLAHIHLDRGRYASSLKYKPGFTHGSLTQSWMPGMPLLWTLKTSSAAPMRDKLIFFWPSFDTVDRGILDCASGRLGLPS